MNCFTTIFTKFYELECLSWYDLSPCLIGILIIQCFLFYFYFTVDFYYFSSVGNPSTQLSSERVGNSTLKKVGWLGTKMYEIPSFMVRTHVPGTLTIRAGLSIHFKLDFHPRTLSLHFN